MILEIADIRITSGREAEFSTEIQRGLNEVVSRAQGFRGFKVHHSVESPDRFVMLIWWDTLEDHTVHFRGGPLFAQWRAIVGPFFAAPPNVEHFDTVAES